MILLINTAIHRGASPFLIPLQPFQRFLCGARANG